MAYAFSRMEKMVAILIISAIVIVASSLIFIGVNKGWLKQRYTYFTEFNTAKGLKEGMQVKLKDIPIGKIRKLSLTKENLIDTEVEVYEEYVDRVREDSVLVLKTELLGGGDLVLYPGTPESPMLKDNSFIQSAHTERGALLKRKHEITMAQDGVDEAISSINDLAQILGDPDGDLQQLLHNLNKLSYNLTQASESGNINYFLYNPKVRRDVEEVFDGIDGNLYEINTLVSNLNVTAGTLSDENEVIVEILENTKTLTEELEITIDKLNNNRLLGTSTKQKTTVQPVLKKE